MADRWVRRFLGTGSVLFIVLFLAIVAHSQVIAPPFDTNYTLTNLGSVPGLPTRYGGLTFMAGDPNTILIGGAANVASGAIYSIGVTRDAGNHITGFTGSATFFSEGAYNDGGVVYGPGGVLFLARWPQNQLGQTKPGSTITDKIVNLAALGVAASGPGGLNFVPAGFPGTGQMKLVAWPGGQWYTLDYAPDGTGTYNINSATYVTTIVGGPEGIFYVPTGSPQFTGFNMLVSEYSAGRVAAYSVDANGNPVPASRVDFITGLTGAEGAAIDPLTNDFLFSTFGGANQVVVVRGFAPPPPSTSDFGVSCNPASISAALGGNATTICTVTSANGFANAVTLSCSGLPAGVTCDFTPAILTPPADGSVSSTLTVAVSSTSPLGSFTPQVVGTSGDLTHTTAVQLVIAQQQLPVTVPTMTEWGMIILTVLLGTGSVYFIKRQGSPI